MKKLSSFTFFYRYLFSKNANSVVRRVSFICFFGLAISIGSLLIVFNIMGGLGQSIKDNFLKTQPHVLISFDQKFSAKFNRKQKEKIQTILKSSHLYSGVSDFYFYEDVDVLIRTVEGGFSGAVAKGYESGYLTKFLKRMEGNSQSENFQGKAPILEGELLIKTPQLVEEEINSVLRTGIIVGLNLASELDLYEQELVELISAENLLLPPGEPIQFESTFISSIVSTQNSTWNSSYIFYDRNKFPTFRESSSYTYGFEIMLHNPENFLAYKKVLEKEGYTVEVWSERNSSIFFALKVEKLIMSIFLSLAGLITLLAVSSLLVLLIVQKRKEQGILMAMGMNPQKVQKLFMGIGILLCFSGMLGGGFLSLVVSLFLKYYDISLLSQFNAGGTFPVEFNLFFTVLLFVAVFVLACINCFLSVRSQSRLLPADLLKTIDG